MQSPSSDVINAIVHAETWFPGEFAEVHRRDWGVLFVAPATSDSDDDSHACVLSRCDERAAVEEIASFYEGRSLVPRVEYISASGDYPELREALAAAGFTIRRDDAAGLFLHERPSRITPNADVHVKRVDRVNADMFAALTSIEDIQMAKLLQLRLSRADSWLFVGEIDGQAASVVLLERTGDICLVDVVHTASRYRCRGCGRATMHGMVAYYQEHFSEPLYLWTDNPVAERIYLEAGFAKMAYELTDWSACREESGDL